MSKVTMIGCDVHDASLVLQVAVGQEAAVKKKFGGSEVTEMIAWLKEFAQRRESSRIVLAYEASSRGFGLYDKLTEAGIECYVLAPTHLPRSTHRQKNKTDDKDANLLLNEVRAANWVTWRGLPIAGNSPPTWVWRRRLMSRARRTTVRDTSRGRVRRVCGMSSARRLGRQCGAPRSTGRLTRRFAAALRSGPRLPLWR